MPSRFRLKLLCVSALLSFVSTSALTAEPPSLRHDYNCSPVPFSHVRVLDGFWSPRLEANRSVTIPYAFDQCKETDRISNFEKAAGLKTGKHEGTFFNDSDVYKIMEGAAYSLQVHPDPQLRRFLDSLIEVVGKAQWEDGYLYTFYSLPQRQPENRWSNIGSMHEQYCVGHMYEAAAAHREVTGEETFLNIAKKNADLICDVFSPSARTDPPGHQEIEIGLCKLYRATGDEKYLRQAKFFLDQRGRLGRRGPHGDGGLYGAYCQDQIPVVEQTEAVGHSVRAAYLYTGMADVAALTGDMQYVEAIDRIWDDVVDTKLYLTGGIGASGGNEGFGGPYELPNSTAYCETCASIANALWNHRMFLMHADAKYIDVLERSIYNATLSGISMRGDRFFYPNVLESIGGHDRQAWFGCACCPSNVARFIPSIPGFAYASKDDDIYVNLYLGDEANVETKANVVQLTQTTDYPWDGNVKISVAPEHEQRFAILLRIPGWAQNQPVPSDLYRFTDEQPLAATVKVNGEAMPMTMAKGYVRLERDWKKADTIEVLLPMPVRRVISNEKLETNRDKMALQRGPLVYCLEGVDNQGAVLDLYIPDSAQLTTRQEPDLLGGIVTISGTAGTSQRTSDGRIVANRERDFKAIPYYAWAHRGRTPMTVWPGRVPQGTRPKPGDTLTYRSQTTASFVHVSLDAIKDQNVPANSADASNSQLDFWPHNGTTEWVQFEWPELQELSSAKLYWFDDSPAGGCSVPASWRVLYKTASGDFQQVKNRGPFEVEKDRFNQVEFEPVKSTTLKIEIQLQTGRSAGIQEVVIGVPEKS